MELVIIIASIFKRYDIVLETPEIPVRIFLKSLAPMSK
jgi:hypothetical protein